jgi:hypothetical protein
MIVNAMTKLKYDQIGGKIISGIKQLGNALPLEHSPFFGN